MATTGPGAPGHGGTRMSIVQSAAPGATTTATPSSIQQLLEENERIISAIVEKQKTGQIGECRELLKQLHGNLQFLAACADNQSEAKPRAPMHQSAPSQAMSGAPGGQMAASSAPSRDQSWPMDPMMQSNAQARHNGGAAKPSTPSFPATSMHMNTNGNAATAKKTTVKAQKWSEEEHRTCLRLYEEKGRMYKEIAQQMGTRSVSQVRSHLQKYLNKQKKDNEARAATPSGPGSGGNGAPISQGYGSGAVPSSRGLSYSTSIPSSRGPGGSDSGMHSMHPQSQVQQQYHGMGGMSSPAPSPYGMTHMGGGGNGPPPTSSTPPVGYNHVNSHPPSGMGQPRMARYPMQDMNSGMGNPSSNYSSMGGPNGQMNSNG